MIIQNSFLCRKKHFIVVVLLPNFHLAARSSSFFLAFFFTFMENLFKKHPISHKNDWSTDASCCSRIKHQREKDCNLMSDESNEKSNHACLFMQLKEKIEHFNFKHLVRERFLAIRIIGRNNRASFSCWFARSACAHRR